MSVGERGDPTVPFQVAFKRQRQLEGSGDVEEVVCRGGNIDEASPVAMFDLDMRTDRLPLEYEWGVRSKARAEKIRLGHEKLIMWWANDKKLYPLERVRLKADTCVHQFQIDVGVCDDLHSFLADPGNYEEQHGFLMMAGTQWPGYGKYPFVHARNGPIPAAQEIRTARVHGTKAVNTVLMSTPQVSALLAEVRRALGLPIPAAKVCQPSGKGLRAMHFLYQDATQQASFSWHDDGEDLGPFYSSASLSYDMTTVIVNLSDECSAMRIWGCAPALYRARGNAVAFPGRALHETVPRCATSPAAGVTRKVALFFN